jgi:hypothetical protein
MNIITKFDLGQTVWGIENKHVEAYPVCLTCEGTGHYTLKDGKQRNCPECYGRGTLHEWRGTQWAPIRPGVIGCIEIAVYQKVSKGRDQFDDKFCYMLDITGVGSGQLWYENTLFPSLEDAEARCLDLNTQKEEDGS